MQIHDVLVKITKKKKRVGRGGKRGTTSGRGTKGQKSRAGHKIRPALRDLVKKIPKRRGVKFSIPRAKRIVLGLGILDKHFKAGQKVTPKTLHKHGLINTPYRKSGFVVKILDRGKITRKLIFENIDVSKTAADKIFAAGGEVRHVK